MLNYSIFFFPLLKNRKTAQLLVKVFCFASCLVIVGFYIRFLSTLHHLEEALDEYAQVPPDFLTKNTSITSELITGMYNGGYFKEVVYFVDYLTAVQSFERMDSMNYSRIMTENLKAKAKLGCFDDLQEILDKCFQKHVLFLPLSYAEIISVCFLFSSGNEGN